MTDLPVLHTSHIPVRWADMDALGHVNNARYFTYAEQARIEWIDAALDGDWSESSPVLASISADFKRPIVHPATVEVQVMASETGRSSLKQPYRLLVDGEVMCDVHAVIVWISRETGRPVSLPDSIRAAASGVTSG